MGTDGSAVYFSVQERGSIHLVHVPVSGANPNTSSRRPVALATGQSQERSDRLRFHHTARRPAAVLKIR